MGEIMIGYEIGAYFSSCRLNTTVCSTALVNNKENIQGYRTLAFCDENRPVTGGFPHKDQCIT